jgi:inner membrane protein
MDDITHALTGAVIAKAGLGRSYGKTATRVLWLSALFPDSDFVLYFFSRQTYIMYHRGISHSFVALPIFALVLAILFYRFSHIKRFWYLTFLCGVGLTSHIILDLITSYGTMIFYPLSDRRFALDYVFIIDLIPTALVGLPLLYIRLTKRSGRNFCRAGIVLFLLYICGAAFHHNLILNKLGEICREKKLVVLEMDALPQPPIPYKWLCLVKTPTGIYQDWLALGQKGVSGFRWFPNPESNGFIAAADRSDTGKLYRWFARYPVVEYRAENSGEKHIIEYFDLRFSTGLFGLHHRPFVLQIVFDKDGKVITQSFK